MGSWLIWTPIPEPVPPLEGFAPISNQGIRLETPIHVTDPRDHIIWTPTVKPIYPP
jgi:hypothetical protein